MGRWIPKTLPKRSEKPANTACFAFRPEKRAGLSNNGDGVVVVARTWQAWRRPRSAARCSASTSKAGSPTSNGSRTACAPCSKRWRLKGNAVPPPELVPERVRLSLSKGAPANSLRPNIDAALGRPARSQQRAPVTTCSASVHDDIYTPGPRVIRLTKQPLASAER
jgi:hypothetical protein